jgi:hypothetical protein
MLFSCEVLRRGERGSANTSMETSKLNSPKTSSNRYRPGSFLPANFKQNEQTLIKIIWKKSQQDFNYTRVNVVDKSGI